MTKTLLYRVADHNGGLVFATRDRAQLVARIHEAIRRSKTWADFRRAMPRREYSELIRVFDDAGERRPKGNDEFSGEMIPGWADGDFPPWLQPEMSRLIPASLLQRYGEHQATAVNGSFWWICPESADALCAELSALGWKTEHAPSLLFW